jgi:hypothetical protein
MNEEQEAFTSGVDALIGRMKTHPEEFFGNGGRWNFMYKEHFRDVMTESEKGRLHEALKGVRRTEFDALVVKELMKDEKPEQSEMEFMDEVATDAYKYSTKNRHKFTATDAEMAKKFNVPIAEYAKTKKELGL